MKQSGREGHEGGTRSCGHMHGQAVHGAWCAGKLKVVSCAVGTDRIRSVDVRGLMPVTFCVDRHLSGDQTMVVQSL